MKFDFAVINDQGPRSVNENSYYCNPESSLFVISDGLGGKGYGDDASSMVVKSLVSFIEHAAGDSEATMVVKRKAGVSTEQTYLINALNFANSELLNDSKSSQRYPKMGASVSAAIVRQRYVSMVGLGDVRIFLFRDGKLKKISVEQTLPSVVLIDSPRAEQDIPVEFLGIEESINVFSRDERLKENDLVIMMTGSIPRRLTEREMSLIIGEEITRSSGESQKLDRICREIVKKSRLQGNRDNATVVVISRGSS